MFFLLNEPGEQHLREALARHPREATRSPGKLPPHRPFRCELRGHRVRRARPVPAAAAPDSFTGRKPRSVSEAHFNERL